jgi:hypothetical protein
MKTMIYYPCSYGLYALVVIGKCTNLKLVLPLSYCTLEMYSYALFPTQCCLEKYFESLVPVTVDVLVWQENRSLDAITI